RRQLSDLRSRERIVLVDGRSPAERCTGGEVPCSKKGAGARIRGRETAASVAARSELRRVRARQRDERRARRVRSGAGAAAFGDRFGGIRGNPPQCPENAGGPPYRPCSAHRQRHSVFSVAILSDGAGRSPVAGRNRAEVEK